MKTTLLMAAACFLSLASCDSPTCGNAACNSFKFFPEPANARSDKSIYSCISTDSDKVTSYELRDGDEVLVDCEDADGASDCRFSYNEAREAACSK